MHRFAAGVACVAFLVARPANAQSVDATLKAFGLLGTWSPNCSDGKSQPRLTFVGGAQPTAAFTKPANDESGEADVTAAERVADDKISVTVTPAKRNGKPLEPGSSDTRPQSMVIEKVADNKIKGPGGQPFEKRPD